MPHETPTAHFVEAKFELGQNIADSLLKGDQVIVVGREHTESWGDDGAKQYGRVIEAEAVGAALNRATAIITRNARPEQNQQ